MREAGVDVAAGSGVGVHVTALEAGLVHVAALVDVTALVHVAVQWKRGDTGTEVKAKQLCGMHEPCSVQ